MVRFLWTAALGLLSVSHAQAAEGDLGFRAESGTSVYSNNDDLTVISPWVRAQQEVAETATVAVGWKADAITAASVDVVTAATPAFEETRHEASVDVSGEWNDARGQVGYILSDESDARAHLMTASGQVEVLDKNLTLGLGYALGLDAMGTRFQAREDWRDRTGHRIDATVSQLLGPSTVVSAAYTLQRMSGLLSSPYRKVPLFPRGETRWTRANAQWVEERHPDARTRHAETLRIKHALTPRLFVNAEYRLYLDTWAMRSHTGEIGAAAELARGFVVEASNRFYYQSSVSFYRAAYTVNRDYLTRDRRLSKFVSDIASLRLRFQGAWIEGLLDGALHWTTYDDFRVLTADTLESVPDVWALVIQAAVSVEF